MMYVSKKVFIASLEYREYSEEAKDSKTEVLWTDMEGLKILRILFRIIKSEMSEVNQLMNIQEEPDSEKYFRVISNNFNLEDDNLYEKILKRVKKLKDFHFRSGGLTFHFDEIVEQIKALRFKRIRFWENLLKDFTNNKDFYLSKIKQKKKQYS